MQHFVRYVAVHFHAFFYLHFPILTTIKHNNLVGEIVTLVDESSVAQEHDGIPHPEGIEEKKVTGEHTRISVSKLRFESVGCVALPAYRDVEISPAFTCRCRASPSNAPWSTFEGPLSLSTARNEKKLVHYMGK
jgi:hypothetical protein